jgi:hypothetical protein
MFLLAIRLCLFRSFLQPNPVKPGCRTWRKAIDWADPYDEPLMCLMRGDSLSPAAAGIASHSSPKTSIDSLNE